MIRLKKVKYLSVLILFIIFSFYSCKKDNRSIEKRTVKVGLYENNPKIFTGKNGKAQGIFIDILEEIAKTENWQIEYINADWSELVLKLDNKEIDLLPDFPYTEKNDSLFNLNKVPVLRSWIEIYDDSYDMISNIRELNDLKIGVLASSLQEQIFNEEIKDKYEIDFELITFSDYNRGVEMLLDQEIDVIASNRFFYFSENCNENNLYSTHIILNPTNLHFATYKNSNNDLIKLIDENLSLMLNDPNSKYYKTHNKWFLKYKSDFRNYRLFITHIIVFLITTLISLAFIFLKILRKNNRELKRKYEELDNANTNLTLTNYQKEITNSKLVDTNELLNDISNSLPIGLYRIIINNTKPKDKFGMYNHKLIYCNKIFCQIIGETEGILKENTYKIIEKIHPNELEAFIGSNFDIPPNKNTYYWKGRLLIGENVKWVIFESAQRKLNDFESVWTGTLTDITNEVLREKEQKKDKQIFNTLAEISPSGIFRTDSEGLTTYVNPKWSQLSGLSLSEAQGNGWLSAVHPEDRKKISEEWNQIVPYRNAGYSQYRFLRVDGSIKWVVGYVSPEIIDDELIGYIGTITDISEIKEAQEVLKESEQKYRMITENITDVVWLADLNLKVHYVSPSIITLTGETVDEHLNNPLEKKLPPESIQIISKAYQEELLIEQMPDKDINRTRTVEVRHYKKDGSLIWISMAVSFIRDENGQPIQIQGVSRDIENLKKTQEELIKAKEKAEESDRLKSSFLANMSHEIRTPMNGILGFAQLLRNPDLKQENQVKFVDIIQKSGQRMLNIINDIIDISKIESGQIEIAISEISINNTLQDLHSFFKVEAESKDIKLIYSKNISLNNLKIDTDSDKFYAIMTNLIKNAIKFTEKGQIQFGASIEDNKLLFFVKDSGVGIKPEKTEIIFERFRQGSEKYSRNYEGAGLGLFITKSFVNILGGKIWVESEYEKGSTFYFTLPLSSKSKIEVNINEKDYIEENTLFQKSKDKKIKVLITEDEEVSSMLLFQLINFFSSEVLYATNGLEAIETIEKHKDIDLILMDLKMPVMDGIEASQKIRETNKKVVIIAQSAFAMIGDDKKAIEAGCNAYITKPINKDKLYNLVYQYFYTKN